MVTGGVFVWQSRLYPIGQSSYFFRLPMPPREGKIQSVPNFRFSQNLDRISVLSATIILAYTFSSFIIFPARTLSTQLPGFYLEILLNTQTIVSLLVVGLTVSGTDWLLRSHPSASNRSMRQHLLIPALTAWIIGVPLSQQTLGLYWWAGIFLGGGTLILVLMAEYAVVDPNDSNYTLASIGLTTVAYALFFLLSVTLKAIELRLFLLVPVLTLVVVIISLRTFHLRLRGDWAFRASGLIALIMAQIAAAFYYLPFSPVAFGLSLLGPAYGLINLFGNLAEGKSWKEFNHRTDSCACYFLGSSYFFAIKTSGICNSAL